MWHLGDEKDRIIVALQSAWYPKAPRLISKLVNDKKPQLYRNFARENTHLFGRPQAVVLEGNYLVQGTPQRPLPQIWPLNLRHPRAITIECVMESHSNNKSAFGFGQHFECDKASPTLFSPPQRA